jgi:hypothetical protein
LTDAARADLLTVLAQVIPTLLIAAALEKPFKKPENGCGALVRMVYLTLMMVGLSAALSGIIGAPSTWKCYLAAIATGLAFAAFMAGFVDAQIKSWSDSLPQPMRRHAPIAARGFMVLVVLTPSLFVMLSLPVPA